ncbi:MULTISPECIES: methionine/alanine import family NSS transporter small subunit [unclassified Streptomyces]|nr:MULTISPECIES: methionine/alanine import family NSS transporter small subunit [unclassified Streptomyces]MBD0837168.1 methionine/alanine import family NSS transporter small subunit [Streptomyces sp. TRM68416]
MSAGAVIMMLIAILIVWGGLVLAIIQLRRHPDPGPDPEEEAIPHAE